MHFSTIKALAGRLVWVFILPFAFIYITRDIVPGPLVSEVAAERDAFAAREAEKLEARRLARLEHERTVKRLSDAIVAKFVTVKVPDAVAIVNAALKEGKRYHIDPTLILAICAVESSFNPLAISGKDHGLMQVNIFWQKGVADEVGGAKGLLNPFKNLYAGSKVISTFIRQEGSERQGLRAYNGKGKDNNYPDLVLNQKQFFELALRD